jgi:DNA polymerase-3 subunit gamma/tau
MCCAITAGRAMDVVEIDAASNRGIDDIRELRERINYAPNTARYKVYIIDEVHMLTEAASNALLKTLEEPPPYAILILATTEPFRILPTILSRCQRFDFHRISQAAMVSRLEHVCKEEGITIEPQALRLIARSATGSLRDAENLLEQSMVYYGSEIELGQVQDMLGLSAGEQARELAKHIIDGNIAAGLSVINGVAADGIALGQFNRQLVEYLRELLLIRSGAGDVLELTPEDMAEVRGLADKASVDAILRAIRFFGQIDVRSDECSPLPLELALVESIAADSIEISPGRGVDGEIVRSEFVAEPATAVGEIEEGDRVLARSEGVVVEPASCGASISVEQLRANWKKMLDEIPSDLKKTRSVALLRSSCVPVILDEGALTLEFRYDIHREAMEIPENRRVAEEVIGRFLGHPCSIRCVSASVDEGTKQRAGGGHLVKAALEMGAKIIDMEER